MSKKSVSEVKKVTDISMKFIVNFLENIATDEQADEIMEMEARCKKEEVKNIRADNPGLSDKEVEARANRQYFGAFRAEFAKRFYPELLSQKKGSGEKKSALELAYERRKAQKANAED